MSVRSNFIVTYLFKGIKPHRIHAFIVAIVNAVCLLSLSDFIMQIIYVPWPPVSFLSYTPMLSSNTEISNSFVGPVGSAGRMISVATTQPRCYSAETLINNT